MTVRADDAQVAQNLMDDFRTITRVSKNGGKKWDRWRGAGTLHVRRWRPPHGIPHCTRWNMKKTIDSLDVSENIPQRPPSCWSWAALFWHTPPPNFFSVCSQFIAVIRSLQPGASQNVTLHLINIIFAKLQ